MQWRCILAFFILFIPISSATCLGAKHRHIIGSAWREPVEHVRIRSADESAKPATKPTPPSKPLIEKQPVPQITPDLEPQELNADDEPTPEEMATMIMNLQHLAYAAGLFEDDDYDEDGGEPDDVGSALLLAHALQNAQ